MARRMSNRRGKIPRARLSTRLAQAKFLEVFAESGLQTPAARAAGVQMSTVRTWKIHDAKFAELFADAVDHSADLLEKEARRRAETGWDEPVFQGGKQVGVVHKYSDTLLALLLKGRRRDVFKDAVELDGKLKTGPLIDPRTSSDEELEARLVAALAKLRSEKDTES